MRPVVKLLLARGAHRREALVVAEVEIGLGAVVGDEDFAVLERRHRAGIDVDVRIEFLQRDAEAARFEQRADRGRGDPFAESGNDAAGDEDVFSAHRHASGWLREFGPNGRGAVRAALLAGRVVLAVAKKRVRVSTQLTNALRGYFFSASSCSTRATSSGRSTPRWGLVV